LKAKKEEKNFGFLFVVYAVSKGDLKRMDQKWTTTTDTIREYNETFSNFESRVLRLDEHINNMHRRSRGFVARIGLFLLQIVIWVIGLLFGYGISIVYLFRRKNPLDGQKKAAQVKEQVKERVAQLLGTNLDSSQNLKKS
jgi:hypothetical protein